MLAFAGSALQATVAFDIAIFGDTQENDTVDGALDDVVKFALIQMAVVQRHVFGQGFSPGFHFAQEGLVDAERSAGFFVFDPFAQGAIRYCFATE